MYVYIIMFACICWLHVCIIHFLSFIHICKCASYVTLHTNEPCLALAHELNRAYHKCQARAHNVENIDRRTEQLTESVCVIVGI